VKLRSLLVLTLVCCGAAAHRADAGDDVAEPDFQASVRMLLRLQDAVAAGHADADRLQGRLILEIEERHSRPDNSPLANDGTARAALGFVLSGGPPGISERLAKSEGMSPEMNRLLEAAILFKRNRSEEATKLLADVDPLVLPADIGGRIALAEAILVPEAEIARKLRHFNIAAQLMPGTLIEESALRRASLFAMAKGEFNTSWKAADRYFRRFAKSPYAAEFVEALSFAIANQEANGKRPDRDRLQTLLDRFPVELRRRTYLNLARIANRAGLAELAQFAARRAGRLSGEGTSEWQRAMLYDAAQGLAGDAYVHSRASLGRIDAALLGEHERKLLAAALSVADSIRSPPPVAPGTVHLSPPQGVFPPEHLALSDSAEKAMQAADRLLKELADGAEN
jgi:chemotaxis protein MotC